MPTIYLCRVCDSEVDIDLWRCPFCGADISRPMSSCRPIAEPEEPPSLPLRLGPSDSTLDMDADPKPWEKVLE